MDSIVRKDRGVLRRSASLLLVASLSSFAAAQPIDVDDRAAGTPNPCGVLTLRDAISAALTGNPELAAFSAELRTREALTLQAGLRPNPALQAEVENVGGSGRRHGAEEAETTLLLSQLVELGGKRAKRERAAALGHELASWDYEAKRLDVLTHATKAFITVIVAQERTTLATSVEELSTKAVESVERSVAAGASPPVETTRARVTLGRARLQRAQAERELSIARGSLAAVWGGREACFARAIGDLTRLPKSPPEAELLEALPDSPDLARWTTERNEREASLKLEQARGIPDVTLGAGGRHFSDTEDNALVFELSVPLPVFDRNQGSIAAARSRFEKAKHEAVAADVASRAAVHEAYQRLLAASEQAEDLRSTILPEARASLAGTRDAFRKGLLRPLDLFESQRTRFELEGNYVTALEAAHVAAADLERLTAVSLENATHGEPR